VPFTEDGRASPIHIEAMLAVEIEYSSQCSVPSWPYLICVLICPLGHTTLLRLLLELDDDRDGVRRQSWSHNRFSKGRMDQVHRVLGIGHEKRGTMTDQCDQNVGMNVVVMAQSVRNVPHGLWVVSSVL